ncbi:MULTISPECIES: RHS repeat-associated core domain-containing protein [Pseudomonas]|uniref:RHS repeat-associated core domain-containing protein n=1 Tax=Pseudomonas TaxID=286 RepID=UPI001BE94E7E|nr:MULTISPECIES: RHS repeat-associated core domain-containing protein [Pseudomonas]MBT2338669.1 RHS repeat-associated core domain-containing protein [Pseudomonas fluorescens]MCD4531847.1 RHS repeat-associated core domain-containing protein [Pseudomonas sp. C3-2018]
MSSKEERVQVIYSYDPLDRHTHTKNSDDTRVQIFYRGDRVATELAGDTERTVFEAESAVLAQQTTNEGAQETLLIAHDDKRSPLLNLRANEAAPETTAYTPFGHSPVEKSTQRVLGFNGERPDRNSGFYLLGNGYRAFNTVLMRFNSPDNRSPFGDGGINAYAYCAGDPVNRTDPSGHSWMSLFKGIANLAGRKSPVMQNVGQYARVKSSTTQFKIYARTSVNDTFERAGRFPRGNGFTQEKIVELAKKHNANMIARDQKILAKQAAKQRELDAAAARKTAVDNLMNSDPRVERLRGALELAEGDLARAERAFERRGGRVNHNNKWIDPENAFQRKIGITTELNRIRESYKREVRQGEF